MIRSMSQIKRELVEAEAMAEAAPASYDNDGNLVASASARRYSYARRAALLRQERDQLLALFPGIEEAEAS